MRTSLIIIPALALGLLFTSPTYSTQSDHADEWDFFLQNVDPPSKNPSSAPDIQPHARPRSRDRMRRGPWQRKGMGPGPDAGFIPPGPGWQRCGEGPAQGQRRGYAKMQRELWQRKGMGPGRGAGYGPGRGWHGPGQGRGRGQGRWQCQSCSQMDDDFCPRARFRRHAKMQRGNWRKGMSPGRNAGFGPGHQGQRRRQGRGGRQWQSCSQMDDDFHPRARFRRHAKMQRGNWRKDIGKGYGRGTGFGGAERFRQGQWCPKSCPQKSEPHGYKGSWQGSM